MAITEPALGSTNWGTVLNAALTQLDTIGPSAAFITQTLAAPGAVTINAASGAVQQVILGANATSSSITNATAGQYLVIEWLQNGTGGFTYAWPSNILWLNGKAPNASKGANKADVFRFVYDGTNWIEVSRNVGIAAAAFNPTATAGSNAGGTPPAPVVAATSTDARGSLTCGTGTTPAAGNLVVVTFGQTYASAPAVVHLTETTSAAAALNEYVTSITASGFTIATQGAPAASQANTVYGFQWTVIF